MRLRSALLIPIIGFLAFATPVYADEDNGGPTKPPGISNPEDQKPGEKSEFPHRISEEHEGGFEAVQFVVIGGAIAVAIFLAYAAGKRSKSKKSKS